MIYLDNAATTKVCLEAVKAANEAFCKNYANPASLHSAGFKAETALENAREIIAKAAGVRSNEIYFTPSGTCADNLAICGFLKNKKGKTVITTAFEHPAVLECFKNLKDLNVIYLKPENGKITPELLQKAITPDTVFVSICHVNNETGAVSPLNDLANVIKKSGTGAVFHTDAVQGFMKEPFNYSAVDMASFSGHKVHAPKGIGALYIKKGIKIKPVIYGGGQENGLFSSTSNVPGALAFAAAVENCNIKNNYSIVKTLCDKTKIGLENFGGKIISPQDASPYIINAIFEDYIGENIVHFLSQSEIYISTGSACSSKHSSYVYSALGLERYQKNSLRISFSEYNTEIEIGILLENLHNALNKLIRSK
ncbi:MAG: cysteine desulfurase [Clostridiales bacterium]|nr:MAG: cysteine desulfurase [Clostridiales bacterium]